MESKYSHVNEVEEVIATSVENDTIVSSHKISDVEYPITLWCFRVIFTAGIITVWCLSLHFQSFTMKDFFMYCKKYECMDIVDQKVKFLNNTHCSLQYNISSELITFYFPPKCQLQVNDECILMMTLTWLLPFFGMLFSGTAYSEIIWRRFCFVVELIINFLIFCNNVYIFMIIDAFILYGWFVGTPFMCRQRKIVR